MTNKIVNTSNWSICTITSIKNQIKNSNYIVHYDFIIDQQVISNSDGIDLTSIDNINKLKGRKALVLYLKSDIFQNRIIITDYQIKKYNISPPDSLKHLIIMQ